MTKDRVVHLDGQLFEAPIDLIGERVEILYNPEDLSDIEARFKGKSYGFLKLLDMGVNAKIYRDKSEDEVKIGEQKTPDINLVYQSGKLFCESESSQDLSEIF